MFRVIGAAPGSTAIRDWPDTWRKSPEYSEVQKHLSFLEHQATREGLTREFASPFYMQLSLCTKRVFAQYWRTPSYLCSKLAMCFITVSLGQFFAEPLFNTHILDLFR